LVCYVRSMLFGNMLSENSTGPFLEWAHIRRSLNMMPVGLFPRRFDGEKSWCCWESRHI
jgi:hypothetical protein